MILKAGVPEPSLPKNGSPTIQKNITFKKIGVQASKVGVQVCKSAVRESSISFNCSSGSSPLHKQVK